MLNEIIYTDIEKYSNEIEIEKELLVEAFKIENYYHGLLIKEKSFKKREIIYSKFYHELLTFYGRVSKKDDSLIDKINLKNKQVNLFNKELYNKSIIDFGCGEGHFLMNIHNNIKHKKLLGIDIFIPDSLKKNKSIEFISSSIINFKSNNKYDVAFSDNVLEHLSILDYPNHFNSIYRSLKPGGKLIILMPNRLFGPADITRIIDNSSSGKTSAMGGHINESTYTEIVNFLKKAGFKNFKTVIPIPKIKHYKLLKNIRLGTKWIRIIENNNFLLKLFRSIKIKGRCPVRFSITIVCQKPLILR